MFDHIGLKVKNPDVSARFYKAVLAPLGYLPDSSGTGFGPANEPARGCYKAADSPNGGTHVALRAGKPRRRRRFHRRVSRPAGGTTAHRGAHRLWPAYYAAFLLDPDGNNVEAVCLGEGVDR